MAIEFTRIDHIAMAVEDIEDQATLMEGLYGFRREREWEEAGERGVGFRFGETDIRWELVAPADVTSPLQVFLDGPRGPGVHHVGIEVADLGRAAESLRELGVEASSTEDGSRLVVPADGAGQGIEIRFFEGDAHPAARPASTSTRGDAARPSLGISRVDHICTAFRDRDELSRHYERLLGMKQIWITHEGAAPDFCDAVNEIPGGQMTWEVIQPLGEESFVQTFLDRRGPAAVHHLAFQVTDFDAAKAACEHYEIPTFDEHDDSTDGIRWRDLFIHPRYTGGLLTQIFWEEEPLIWVRSDKVRPAGFEG